MASITCSGCFKDLDVNDFIVVPIDIKMKYFCHECARNIIKEYFESYLRETQNLGKY